MDPDVIEIPPPPPSRPKRPRFSQREVIHIDDGDDLDVMIIDEKIDTKNKGKGKKDNAEVFAQTKAKEALGNHSFYPPEYFVPGSHQPMIGDNFSSDFFNGSDKPGFFSDDLMDYDEYAYLQAQFDKVDIPPGVEAPIPSLLDSVQKGKNTHSASASLTQSNLNAERSKMTASVNNSSFQVPVGSGNASGANLDSFWLGMFAQSEKIKNAPQHIRKRTPNTSRSSSKPKFSSQLQKMSNYFGNGTLYGKEGTASPMIDTGVNHFSPSHPAKLESTMKLIDSYKSKFKDKIAKYATSAGFFGSSNSAPDLPEEAIARSPRNVDEDDILRKYRSFKQFDTVEDHSDHHYASNGSSVKQPPKNWAKRIQEEWRILEKDLPENIFVRVYESRMDLLRAVIIGAEGTPYHDGLFFFDVFLPSKYPNVPPNVHYHSGGLRLNPNLYNCGKVCLSLLGTWRGSKNENWQPGVSTVLQVLVSIQALILNRKPFFNEPGYVRMEGSPDGEKRSQEYNENTFMLSLKTMVYSMKKPPKHFEDFVVGHFHKYGHDIVVACKAYMDGAPVGSLVKGGVQDVEEEGSKSCSPGFKNSLQPHVDAFEKWLAANAAKISSAI